MSRDCITAEKRKLNYFCPDLNSMTSGAVMAPFFV